MAHNPACERAQRHRCVCAGCGGSLHGWPTRLRIAERATEPQLTELRRDAELLWLTKLGSGKRRQNNLLDPPATLRRAAAQGAEADAITWLAHHPEHIGSSWGLGYGLHRDARAAVHDRVGKTPDRPLTPEQVDRSTPGHFWCTLLAELAGAGETVKSASDRVPELAKEQLRAGDSPFGWGEVQDLIADHAMGIVWKCVCAALLGDFTNLLRLTRVMSLFLCPDPAQHPALARCALMPLTKDIVTEEVGVRLRQAYRIDSEPN